MGVPRRRTARRTLFRVSVFLALWSLLCIAAQILLSGSTLPTVADAASDPSWRPRNALILTAHPDDEVMFFAPVVLALVRSGVNVRALCLSQGNADGLGHLRRSELVRAYDVLGVPPTKVTSLDDPELQDGMDERWNTSYIAALVDGTVRAHGIDTIFTFDAYGISSHPNHIACYAGARQYRLASPSGERRASLYALESVPVHLKFLGLAYAVLRHAASAVEARAGSPPPETLSFLSTPRGSATALAAMTRHASQLVWFRYLYVGTSAYMHGAVLRLDR